MSDEKLLRRQMKYLGGVWGMPKGKFGEGIKQRFRVEELEWMLERAKATSGFIELYTDRRKNGGGGRSPTHKTIAYVFEGEWGWDESMPVREVREEDVSPRVGTGAGRAVSGKPGGGRVPDDDVFPDGGAWNGTPF